MVFPPRAHTGKVQDQKNRLTGKEKIIVQQADCHTEWKHAAAILQNGIVQGRQHVGEQCRGIQKEVKENVVDIESAEGHTVPPPSIAMRSSRDQRRSHR